MTSLSLLAGMIVGEWHGLDMINHHYCDRLFHSLFCYVMLNLIMLFFNSLYLLSQKTEIINKEKQFNKLA